MKKISICTVCMNRLQHLQETLPQNIIQNLDYPNVEFVVLDYNSKDGLEDWMQSNLAQYRESGILKYYKNYEPEFFHLGHSKNMVLRLATGDIKCLVDADNFAGPDYAAWVSGIFAENGEDTIITTLRKDRIPFRDQGGKLSFHSNLLDSVNGFDESLVGYGIDDVDLVNRMEKQGGSRYFLTDEKYLKFIGHSTEERLINHPLINKLAYMYVLSSEQVNGRYIILYLMKDGSFFEVTYHYEDSLKDNLVLSYVGWTIRPNGQRNGRYTAAGRDMQLSYDDGATTLLQNISTAYSDSITGNTTASWKKVAQDDEFYLTFIMGYGECINRLKYIENDKINQGRLNENGWGRGRVYLNFEKEKSIDIL